MLNIGLAFSLCFQACVTPSVKDALGYTPAAMSRHTHILYTSVHHSFHRQLSHVLDKQGFPTMHTDTFRLNVHYVLCVSTKGFERVVDYSLV